MMTLEDRTHRTAEEARFRRPEREERRQRRPGAPAGNPDRPDATAAAPDVQEAQSAPVAATQRPPEESPDEALGRLLLNLGLEDPTTIAFRMMAGQYGEAGRREATDPGRVLDRYAVSLREAVRSRLIGALCTLGVMAVLMGALLMGRLL